MVKKNFLKSSLIVLAVLAVALIPTASVKASVANKDVPTLAYSAHVQSFGWMGTKSAGTLETDTNSIAGTEGQCKRVEALRVTFDAPAGVVLKYNAHIQGIGWTGWTAITENNQLVGTEGQSKRLEAIKFSVTGLEGYEIKYRAHVQTYGWMDWVTADSSESLAKIAGTEGECKRIESLQFLILDSETAKTFDLRQEAIQKLKLYATQNEFTMNQKLLANTLDEQIHNINIATTKSGIDAAFNAAKTAVDNLLDDREVRIKINELCDDIDSWVIGTPTANADLDNPINGPVVKVTLTEVQSIKDAIATAKAELWNKEKYELSDFGVNNAFFLDAAKTIKIALVEYAKTEIDKLYNTEVRSQDEEVLSNTTYTTYLGRLNLKEDGSVNEKNLPAVTAIKALLGEVEPNVKLSETITYYTNDLNTKLTDYNGIIGGNSTMKGKLVAAKLISVNMYKEVQWVAEAISTGKEDMADAKNIAQLIEIEDNTVANALSGLKTFVRNMVNKVSTLNGSGHVLNGTQIKAINALMEKENLTVAELIAGFNTMVTGLYENV